MKMQPYYSRAHWERKLFPSVSENRRHLGVSAVAVAILLTVENNSDCQRIRAFAAQQGGKLKIVQVQSAFNHTYLTSLQKHQLHIQVK